jgi:hypothetical protein
MEEEGKQNTAKAEHVDESGQSSSTPAPTANTQANRPAMSNTLVNLRACVKEFDPEQSSDLVKVARKYDDWMENFEACADFEDVAPEKRKPALLALGGEKFRQLCKTLEVKSTDKYVEMKETLHSYFTPKKNTSAERFKFFNTRPESAEETHDKWVMRLKLTVNDCEFDKFNNEEAMKLVIMLHTHNARLQRSILTKDLDFKKTLEEARTLEMTEKELACLKESGSQIGANKVSIPGRDGGSGSNSRRNPPKKNDNNVCRNCGEKYPHEKDTPCKYVI